MDNLILEIIFENEEIKYYDIKKLLSEHKEFEILRDRNLFNLVKVDVERYGISWNDDLDISCNTLYYELYPNSNFTTLYIKIISNYKL